MYDFYYTDWQLDSYKGVNDPCMNWSDSPFLVSTNLGTLQIQTHSIDSCIRFASYNHQLMTIINSEFDSKLQELLTSQEIDIQIELS